MSGLFHDFLYVPIYNLLIFFVDIVPRYDIGIAVILATLVVKIIIMPLSLRAVHTQRRMKLIEPQLKALREKYKDDKPKQAQEMMALYREHNVRPFASIFGILIQLPILIALYLVFNRESLSEVNTTLLYSFVAIPDQISPLFLGIFTISGASLILAAVAVLAQFIQARISIPLPQTTPGAKASAAEDFGRMMAIQARYFLPLMIGVISYVTSGAIALYFITSSLVGIFQEFVVRKMKHPEPAA